MAAEQQQLIFSGKVLEDEKSLVSSGIQKGCEVQLRVKKAQSEDDETNRDTAGEKEAAESSGDYAKIQVYVKNVASGSNVLVEIEPNFGTVRKLKEIIQVPPHRTPLFSLSCDSS